MPKKRLLGSKQSGVGTSASDALQFFRGGKGIAESVVRKELARVRELGKNELEDAGRTRQSMAKHLAELEGWTPPDYSDPKTAKSVAAVRALHEKLAKQKLAAPGFKGGLGGILAGEISARIVAPFDFDVVIPTELAGPAADVSGASNKSTGQMTASAVSSMTPGFGGGSMYTTVGVYFHPPTAGTLSVSASPKFSFQWWTNSLGTNLVRSFGSVRLTVYGVDVASQTTGGVGTIISTAGASIYQWDETQTGQIGLDFGSDLVGAASTSLAVNHTLVYLLFVEAEVHVEGVGWPGSIAGAKLAVTVPSISYDYRVTPVVAL